MDEERVEKEYTDGSRVLERWMDAAGSWIVEDMALTLGMVIVQQDLAQRDEVLAKLDREDYSSLEFGLDFLAIPAALLRMESRMLVMRGLCHLAVVGAAQIFAIDKDDVSGLTRAIDRYMDSQPARYSARGVEVPGWIDEFSQRTDAVDDAIERMLGDEDE